jgi:asparagine synthase (glutamine-hydrolysing)
MPERRGAVYFNRDKILGFLRALGHPRELRNQLWVSPFSLEAVERLTGRSLDERVLEPISRRAAEYAGPADAVTEAMYLDFVLIMHDVFNVKADRASMMASLEVREPFLDTALIELAARMPSKLKVRGLETKFVLKELACRYFPRRFVYRKKWGFGLPLAGWFAGELGDRFLAGQELRGAGLDGLIDMNLCGDLLREHRRGQANHAARLWALHALARWKEAWAGCPTRGAV